MGVSGVVLDFPASEFLGCRLPRLTLLGGYLMRHTYIIPEHQASLEAMLAKAQYRARVRLLTVKDLLAAAQRAETELSKLDLPDWLKLGSVYYLISPTMPKAYRYPSCGTDATFVRKPKGWVVTYLGRDSKRPVPYGCERTEELVLTRPARERLLSKTEHYPLVQKLVSEAYRAGYDAAKATMVAVPSPTVA